MVTHTMPVSNPSIDEITPGDHVMYEMQNGLTHGATVEKLPPWTDTHGTEHVDDGIILLRRPDERVLRVTIDQITERTDLHE